MSHHRVPIAHAIAISTVLAYLAAAPIAAPPASAAVPPAAAPPAVAVSPPPGALSLAEEADMKLCHGGYLLTLENAYWASAQGPSIVPILAKLLAHEKELLRDPDTMTSAFPFNAIWALGRIATPASLAVLQRYQAGRHDRDASLSIAAAKLRLKLHDQEVGVTIREDQPLYAKGDHTSKVLATLRKGTPVRARAYRIRNLKQEGPRGSVATFDKVYVLPKGPEGYLERAGDDFSTVY